MTDEYRGCLTCSWATSLFYDNIADLFALGLLVPSLMCDCHVAPLLVMTLQNKEAVEQGSFVVKFLFIAMLGIIQISLILPSLKRNVSFALIILIYA